MTLNSVIGTSTALNTRTIHSNWSLPNKSRVTRPDWIARQIAATDASSRPIPNRVSQMECLGAINRITLGAIGHEAHGEGTGAEHGDRRDEILKLTEARKPLGPGLQRQKLDQKQHRQKTDRCFASGHHRYAQKLQAVNSFSAAMTVSVSSIV